MFSANEDAPGFLKMVAAMKTFDKETLIKCDKELEKRVIEEEVIIQMGAILSKVLELNGIPKVEYMKRLNRISPFRRKPKDDRTTEHILTNLLDNLEKPDLFTDSTESLRQILFHSDESHLKNCEKWIEEKSESLIGNLTAFKFSPSVSVPIENSCYTIAIFVKKYNFLFIRHYKHIINFLLMIFTEGAAITQAYVDARNEKLKESTSVSFDPDNEQPFHYPMFFFQNNNCLNKPMSIAYFTLAFCLDCIFTPEIVLHLLSYAINTKEVTRYCLMWLIKIVILSIDKQKCKVDPDWADLPWRVHNELIKFYIDKNSQIRNMASEISAHIKQCSAIKLPFITKPVLDTVDIITKVIEQKRQETYQQIDKKESEVNVWKKLLDLDKKINKLSDESESAESSSSKSKTVTNSSIEGEPVMLPKSVTATRSDLFQRFSFTNTEIQPLHTRKTILLPSLRSLLTLTKLRTQKSKKSAQKKSKFSLVSDKN